MKFSVVEFLLILVFPIIVLLFSAFLFLFHWPAYSELLTEITTEDGLIVAKQTLNYFQSNRFEVKEFAGFSEAENEHMQEVKEVIFKAKILFIISVFFFSIFIWFVDSRKVFFIGGFLTLAICLLLLIIPFSDIFTLFHKMIFTKQWMFQASSKMIQIFPKLFFKSFAMRIFSHTFSIAVIIVTLSSSLFFRPR